MGLNMIEKVSRYHYISIVVILKSIDIPFYYIFRWEC